MLTKSKQVARLSLLKSLFLATRGSPPAAVRAVREMLHLRRAATTLGLSEYFYYNLLGRKREEQEAYVGWRLWGSIEKAAVPERWWAVMEDKLVLYALLDDLGFPVPKLLAILQRNRRFGRIRSLVSPQELADFLRSPDACYPFFAKPVSTGRGEGIAAVERLDTAADELVSVRGERIKVDAFVSEASAYFSGGYLLQDLLTPHARIAALSGPAVSTVRFVVAVRDDGPAIVSAAWRIPVGSNVVDNYSQPGNLLGGIDLGSGTVQQVTTGNGIAQRAVQQHPTSGLPLVGFTLPDWRQACDLVLDCAAVLPDIRLQAWDIGLCATGPMVVEANVGGDADVPQIANGRGLLDSQFRGFLEEIGVRLA